MASFAVVAASLRFSPSSKASSGSFGFRLGLRLEELATEAQETLRRLPSRWLRPVEAKEGVLGVFILWSGLSGSDILKRIWGLLEISRTARSPAAGASIAEAFLLECGRLAVGAPEPGAKRSPGEVKKAGGGTGTVRRTPAPFAVCEGSPELRSVSEGIEGWGMWGIAPSHRGPLSTRLYGSSMLEKSYSLLCAGIPSGKRTSPIVCLFFPADS